MYIYIILSFSDILFFFILSWILPAIDFCLCTMAMPQATRPRGAGGYNVVSGGAKPATAKAKSTGTRNAFGALG